MYDVRCMFLDRFFAAWNSRSQYKHHRPQIMQDDGGTSKHLEVTKNTVKKEPKDPLIAP